MHFIWRGKLIVVGLNGAQICLYNFCMFQIQLFEKITSLHILVDWYFCFDSYEIYLECILLYEKSCERERKKMTACMYRSMHGMCYQHTCATNIWKMYIVITYSCIVQDHLCVCLSRIESIFDIKISFPFSYCTILFIFLPFKPVNMIWHLF